MDQWCLLINGVLHFFRFHFNLDTVDDLLTFVVQHDLVPKSNPNQAFSPLDLCFLKSYEQKWGNPDIQTHSLNPPTSLICVSHWRILANMLSLLPNEVREEFKSLELAVSSSGFPISSGISVSDKLPLVDTHFHLDQLLKRTRIPTFQQLEAHGTIDSRFILQAGVANYVYPGSWSGWEDQTKGTPLKVSFGIHPHLVSEKSTSQYFSALSQNLSNPMCVGLGEIGIDLTSRCSCTPRCATPVECKAAKFRVQQEFLYDVIPLCRPEQVLILHCRDSGSGEASEAVLQCLKDLCMTGLKIHCHCFSGSVEQASKWMSVCPNIHFGFTSTLLRSPATADALAQIPLHKILLESDAPYLSPSGHRMMVNTPWHIYPVLEKLAALKNLPPSVLLTYLNRNACNLYQL
jgi:TatD DNase family protein